jgi:hypothetical protein
MVPEQASEVETATATTATAASARLRRETSHSQAGGGNDDHQNTLHRSILQNSVKQGKLLPSMTATPLTRKRCTDSNKTDGSCRNRPPPSKNKPRRKSSEAW